MIRTLFAAMIAIVLAASPSPAQVIAGGTVGAGSFGGGFRPPVPFPARAVPRLHPAFHTRPLAGGFYYSPYYPYSSSFYGGFGGGFSRYSYPNITGPGSYYDEYAPQPIAPVAPPRIVALSGEFPAVLTLEFPAPATVWLDGREVPGKPDAVRMLTSPILKPGEQFTFLIRARWEVNGKRYEYSRETALGPGDRSKLLVLSGTAFDEPK